MPRNYGRLRQTSPLRLEILRTHQGTIARPLPTRVNYSRRRSGVEFPSEPILKTPKKRPSFYKRAATTAASQGDVAPV